MTSFKRLGLSGNTLKAVDKMGYTEPTPVQEATIPVILKGHDVVAAAKTGTGKTGAFAFSAMDKLGHAKSTGSPFMLVITPTRELAQQIYDVCSTISDQTGHRIACIVGGVAMQPQIDKMMRKIDVLIATPGRLIDLMDQRVVNLGLVNTLVLDEADRMLDMGFLPSVRRIVSATPPSRQTLLFSATIDKSVTKHTKDLLSNPVTIEVSHKGEVADTIDQYIIHTPQLVKPALIKAVLAQNGANRVIVFTRTRSRADSCARRLGKAGYKVAAIHSNRTQNQRQRALDQFASGEINIICATDVLARGIDVESVDYVINFDLPSAAEDYVHRIGRTGRAGQSGFSVSFVTPETEDVLRDIQKLTKQKIPEMIIEGFDFEAAEMEAQSRQQAYRAKSDPEIAQAKREIAKKKKKKAAEKASRAALREDPPNTHKPKRSKSKKKNPSKPVDRRNDTKPGRSQRAAKRTR